MGTFLLKIVRIVCSLLDTVVFWVLKQAYALFINIAEAGLFKQETIQQFATRLYAFLGLIMVFKVSISLVSYIMNPDNFNKADVGAPALLKGFIFALVGIVLVPYAFEAAFAFQRIVLSNNIIGNLILGIASPTEKSDEGKVKDNYIEDGGDLMASTTLRAFYRPDISVFGGTEECADNPADCSEFIDAFDSDVQKKVRDTYGKTPIEVSDLLDFDILLATTKKNKKEYFIMKYTPIISALCGGFIAYVLVLFCIDIAVRNVKLSFLQLIAPIPLISKIDPKKGAKVFDKWLNECITTYLDVFLRLIAIYFSLYIITAISSPYRMTTGEAYTGLTSVLVKVFLIIGCLNFARELPNLLASILGIDLKGLGGFTLNPAKKLRQTPLIGGAMAQGLGFAGRTTGRLAGGLAGNMVNKFGSGMNAFANKTGLGEKYDKFKENLGNTKLANLANNMGKTVGKVGNTLGNAAKNTFGEKALNSIKDDAIKTGGGMLGAVENSLGVLDAQDRKLATEQARLAKEEAEILKGMAEDNALMDKNKTMIAANDAVRDRARKKLTESAEYHRMSQNVEQLKNAAKAAQEGGRAVKKIDKKGKKTVYESPEEFNARVQNLYDQAAAAEQEFNRLVNVDWVNEYIDTGGAKFRDDGSVDTTLTSLIEKRDTTAKSLGGSYASQYVDKSAKEADSASTNLNIENNKIMGKQVADNQRLAKNKEDKRVISEKQRAVGETRRASAPYMGGGRGGAPGGKK